MSVVDKLKSLFAKKVPDSEQDSRFSLAMPGETVDSMLSDSVLPDAASSVAAPKDSKPVVDEGDVGEEQADLVFVPGLGRRPVVHHQRLLATFLALSLIVLAVQRGNL
jgi:twitching motility protein PilJ